jgi:hypothetical protein
LNILNTETNFFLLETSKFVGAFSFTNKEIIFAIFKIKKHKEKLLIFVNEYKQIIPDNILIDD